MNHQNDGSVTHRLEHDLPLHLVPQLHGHEDAGQLDDHNDAHEDGVDDEGSTGLEASGDNSEHGEDEEHETDGQDEIRHCGEVGVDQLQVGEEIYVDQDTGEVETGGAGNQHHQVEDTQHCSVLAHDVTRIFHRVMTQKYFTVKRVRNILTQCWLGSVWFHRSIQTVAPQRLDVTSLWAVMGGRPVAQVCTS